MVKVINYDRNGKLIEDISKVVIHLDEFPEVARAMNRIARANATKNTEGESA